jgi:iron(III) transport system ATP-binding protein
MSAILEEGGAAAAGGTSGVPRPPFLEIASVGKQFGRFVALKDVSLSIAEGEFVSFVGPSGCGKTTLLRAIAGLDPATTGVIRQAGREITGLPPAARFRHRLPILRAVPEPDRHAERGLWAPRARLDAHAHRRAGG